MTMFENVGVFIGEKVWLEPNLFPYKYSKILKPSHFSYLPSYEDGTECSEKTAYKIQTPGNYPEESIQNSEHGGSLKSRINLICFLSIYLCSTFPTRKKQRFCLLRQSRYIFAHKLSSATEVPQYNLDSTNRTVSMSLRSFPFVPCHTFTTPSVIQPYEHCTFFHIFYETHPTCFAFLYTILRENFIYLLKTL